MDWYRGALLHPDVDDLAEINPPKSCLLDRQPYLGDRTNSTTAMCKIEDDRYDGMSIRVSFFAARPPGVSHILAWSFGTYFTDEPRVVSTDGMLVLLCFAVDSESLPFPEYYIYQPGAAKLDLIPQPEGIRFVDQFCRAGLMSQDGGSSGYHVVMLTKKSNREFDLNVFSSATQSWEFKKPVLVGLTDEAGNFDSYMTYKSIPLDGGFMAFVDLWNGILICDVLHGGERPELHYLPLPSELCEQPISCYPLEPRDINISVSGDSVCIKLAEVVYPPTSDAWCTDMWMATSMSTSPWHLLKGWHKESMDGSELVVPKGLSLDGLLDSGYDQAEPTIGCLFVDKPILGSHEDNVVCFMVKKHISDRQTWLITVDMAKKKLDGLSRLDFGRSSALFYSTISGHLNMTAAASGARGDLKRHGALLESYPHKKQQHLRVVSSSFGEHDRGSMGAHDQDATDSEHGDDQA